MTAVRRKTAAAFFLVLFISLCCGCRVGSIFLTKSVSGSVLAAGRYSTITVPEANFLFMDCQSVYNSRYGQPGIGNFWEEDVNGMPFGTYLKENRLKNEICALILLQDVAKERGVSLTEEDEENCRNAASAYFSGLSPEEKEFCQAGEQDAVSLFRKYRLAERTIQELTDGAYLEISDNDRRVITIWVICTDSYSKAQALKEQIDAGGDFLQKAKENTLLSQIEYQVSRGDLNPQLEEIAFYLRDGEVSDVISCGSVYYLIRCVEDFDEELSRENEAAVYNRSLYEQWSREVLAYASGDAIGFTESYWDQYRFSRSDTILSENLFECYRDYLDVP